MDNEIELGEAYPLTDVEQAKNTKERILIEATLLFAKRGFAAVSVRDIARQVGIKASSIYAHFESKEALWEAALDHIESLYMQYFSRLDKALPKAENFEEVLECMFTELREVVNIFTYYGFSLVQIEQFRDEKAYHIYNHIFLKYSINYIKEKFEYCVNLGWVKSFDTQITATYFMHSVLTAIMLRTHENMGHTMPYDVRQMFDNLQQHILDFVRRNL